MKRTLMMTAAMMFTGHMAFAAIDPQALADSYIADGYTSVEVKQGLTQTKIEAVKGTSLIEAVYDNASGEIISQETQPADAEELARTGVEVGTADEDFADNSDENDGDQATDEGDDHADENDDGGNDDGDGSDGDNGDDHDGGGNGGGDGGGDGGGEGGND
jgi:hypothetical protein